MCVLLEFEYKQRQQRKVGAYIFRSRGWTVSDTCGSTYVSEYTQTLAIKSIVRCRICQVWSSCTNSWTLGCTLAVLLNDRWGVRVWCDTSCTAVCEFKGNPGLLESQTVCSWLPLPLQTCSYTKTSLQTHSLNRKSKGLLPSNPTHAKAYNMIVTETNSRS